MEKIKLRAVLYWAVPVLGVILGVWYIKNATCDVVYSDYIRLVTSYLPDVYNLNKFLLPDVLTRIPINYLERIVNVELFGFSITLDRVLGVASLGLAGWVFSWYCLKKKIGTGWFLALMVVMFSLNKWEMLTNGSGWCHFLAFAGFYYHEVILDRVWAGEGKRFDRVQLCLLPWLIILGAAGPYGASYAAVLLLAYAFCWIRRLRGGGAACGRQPWLLYMACALIPILLYILSSSYVVEEYAGATGRPLWAILRDNPLFPVRFLLKSFAAIMVGGEDLVDWMDPERGILGSGRLVMPELCCYLIGLFVLASYGLAYWLNWRYRLYERTILPLMLLTGGLINHFLVFCTRYIFERESYALNSSRYTLQFQVGILGILLTFAFVAMMRREAQRKKGRSRGQWEDPLAVRLTAAVFCVAIVLGNGYTTQRELFFKASYREARFEEMAQRALTIPGLSDEEFEEQGDELANLFEYWNGNERIRQAFDILEENGWNVFKGSAAGRQEGGETG